MKTMILATATVLGLGVGVASAQGLPASTFDTTYGYQASSNHNNEPAPHFLGKGTVFSKIFGHGQDAADTTAESNTSSAKGG